MGAESYGMGSRQSVAHGTPLEQILISGHNAKEMIRGVTLGGLAWLLVATAHAQRVDENAVVQAQDAFGLTVGDETIGLYSAEDARGFSPTAAGNLVIEGLYYDQQTYVPTGRIVQGSVLHVGLSAQSYPLAAPTGVVDYQLRSRAPSASPAS